MGSNFDPNLHQRQGVPLLPLTSLPIIMTLLNRQIHIIALVEVMHA